MKPWAALGGRVVDEDLKQVAGVRVEKDLNPRRNLDGDTVTDANGEFVFQDLPPGSYTVVAKPEAKVRMQDGVRLGTVAIYYPSATEPAQAVRIIKSLVRDQVAHSVAVGEMHALSGARLKEVIALRDAYEELVRSVLQDARKAGALRDDISVKYLSLILLGLLNRVEMWYRRDGPLSPDQLARVFEAIFLTGAAASAK